MNGYVFTLAQYFFSWASQSNLHLKVWEAGGVGDGGEAGGVGDGGVQVGGGGAVVEVDGGVGGGGGRAAGVVEVAVLQSLQPQYRFPPLLKHSVLQVTGQPQCVRPLPPAKSGHLFAAHLYPEPFFVLK